MNRRRGEHKDADLGDTALDAFCQRMRETAERRLVDVGEAEEIVAAVESYEHWMAAEFNHPHDHFRLVGEDNVRRYLPLREVRVRVHPDDSLLELFARAAASRTAGCRTVVSTPPELHSPHVKLLDELTDDWAGAIEFVEETDASLAQSLREGHIERLRYAHPDRVSPVLRNAAADDGHYIADTPVSLHGRVELIWYFREQSLSHSYHRYGNLGMRSEEQRAEVM